MKTLHDGCVGASDTNATPALVTPDTAPIPTTTFICSVARKALAAPLPSDALPTGGVRVTDRPSGRYCHLCRCRRPVMCEEASVG